MTAIMSGASRELAGQDRAATLTLKTNPFCTMKAQEAQACPLVGAGQGWP
jgi:hypothetical protein